MTDAHGLDPAAVAVAEAWASLSLSEEVRQTVDSDRHTAREHLDLLDQLVGPLVTLSVLRQARADLEALRATEDAGRRYDRPPDTSDLEARLAEVIERLETREALAEERLLAAGLSWDAEAGRAASRTAGRPRLALTDLVGALHELDRLQAKRAGEHIDWYGRERLARYADWLALCGFSQDELSYERLKARLESHVDRRSR